MKPLALLLCTGFVFYLLRLDRRRAPDVSPALWLPTIWMLLIASKPLAVWFATSGDATGGSPVDRNVLTLLLLSGLLVLFRRQFDWTKAFRDNAWLILLLGFMFISILWGTLDIFVSFKRWIRELTAVAMVFVVLSERSPTQAVESLFRRCIYILIPFSLLLIKYYPEIGVEFAPWSGGRMWIGVTTQKNGLGRLCISAGIFLIWTLSGIWKHRGHEDFKTQFRLDVFVLGLAIFMLNGPSDGAFSATATVSFVLSLALYVTMTLMLRHRLHWPLKLLPPLLFFLIAYGTVTPFLGRLSLGLSPSAIGRDDTLTDRTQVWSQLVPVAMQAPILGHGVAGIWTQETRENFQISEAHNGYLDILLAFGFFGLFMISTSLTFLCQKAVTLAPTSDWAVIFICFLFMGVIHNISESSLYTFTTQLSACILFLAALTTRTSPPQNAFYPTASGELLALRDSSPAYLRK